MLPAAQDWFDDGHWTYVQDSDSKHTAKLTQDWLRTHVTEYITPQQWLTRSQSDREHLGTGRQASLASSAKNT